VAIPLMIFAFVFGTTVGSFLNVVIYRYNTGRKIANDRSVCFSCGKTLAWYELIPIVSYLIQGGRCRKCKSKISPQYILVEIITGMLFVWIVFTRPIFLEYYGLYTFSPFLLIQDILYMAIWSILIVIIVYDLKHKIIPDGLAYAFAAIGFIMMFFVFEAHSVHLYFPSIWNILAGPILFAPFYLLWQMSDGRWMGLGDGKLALGIGWFLGLWQGIVAIILAFWIGAAVGLILIALKYIIKYLSLKRAQGVFHRIALSLGLGERIMKSEIPFAPFLIIGIALVFFLRLDLEYLKFIV
jgi:prepilin signal peptidase PulO-like enzyme (type II secretory pathway)